MNAGRITCTSCGRIWYLLETPEFYLEMAFESQPCPACEAYTLSCRATPPGGPRRSSNDLKRSTVEFTFR